MTYDPSVPQSSQFISTTQPIILNNFNKLNVDFDVDHLPYTTNIGAGNGEHKKITFNNVGSPPYPINTTKSYAYSRFIDPSPGTLTYVEYQSAGAVPNVCPMTPRALFVAVDPGGAPPVALTINRSFNVASVTRVAFGLYTVAFLEPLANTDYIVFPSFAPTGGIVGVAAGRTTAMFQLTTVATPSRIDVMVF